MSLILVACAAMPSAAEDGADLILRNGVFHPVSSPRPIAGSLVVADGRIAFIGDSSEAERFVGSSTRVVDLAGRAAAPGLIDAHAHLESLGRSLEQVDLVGATSYAEVVERLRSSTASTSAGEWIFARGWDQNDWGERSFPHHEALSRAVPDHPVWATRIDGHAALVNERAMRELGLDGTVRDPAGGRYLRDADGELTGVMIDDAMTAPAARIPAPSREQRGRWIESAQEHCLARGLTGVTDMGVDGKTYEAYRQLRESGRLKIRASLFLADEPALLDAWLARGPELDAEGRLQVRGIKLYADGALGSRGAALVEPYSDDPGNSGWLTIDSEHLHEMCTGALEAGFQLGIHAIGDRGALVALDAVEACFGEPRPDVRFRIEHAQVMRLQDIERLAKLGVIASMQPTHATSDMPWAEARVGARRLVGAYAWQRILNAGGRLALGSDFPVEKADPLLGLHAAVSRQSPAGEPPGGWLPDQRLSRAEALRGFTLDAAHSLFQDAELGTLEVGKRADIVVFSADPMTVPTSEIPLIEIDLTIVAGEVVFMREGEP